MARIIKFAIETILIQVLFHSVYGQRNSQRVPVFTEGQKRYENKVCEEKAFHSRRACGVVFEKKECDNGGYLNWFGQPDHMAIEKDSWVDLQGFKTSKLQNIKGLYREIKSVLVAPGCVMFGYETNDKTYRGQELFRVGRESDKFVYQNWLYKDVSVITDISGEKVTL